MLSVNIKYVVRGRGLCLYKMFVPIQERLYYNTFKQAGREMPKLNELDIKSPCI